MDAIIAKSVRLDTTHVLGIGGILLTVIALTLFRSRRVVELKGIPVMTGYTDHEKAMMDGAQLYPTTPFVVETQRPTVIIPPCCFEELKNLPQTKLNFWGIATPDLLGEKTGIMKHTVETSAALRYHVPRNLAGTLAKVEDKITWVLEKEMGNSEEWTTLRLHQFVVNVVSRLVAGVFVGPRFTYDDEWTDLSLGLSTGLIVVRDAIKRWPKFMQPLVARSIPEVTAVNRHITKMAEKVKPVIETSLAEIAAKSTQVYDDGKVDLDADEGECDGTFTTWILPRIGSDPEDLVRAQVGLSFLTTNTTTNALTYFVLDLATKPEYIQPLRDEIEQVARQDNVEQDENGVLRFKRSSLAKLWKLDSFMKESSRLSKGPITNQRLVMQPITLSTGHHLPVGTRIAFSARAVHMSSRTTTFSPEYNPPENKAPHEFDGFRFYRLRQMPGKESKHSFATASPDSLTWGYGNHACPARHFADEELKTIMIELLRKWEFRVTDPVKTNTTALRRIHELVMVAPKQAEIDVRRRKV